MKNHEWRDGQLLQTNKKWSQLKMSQRAWILETTRAEHAAYVEQHGTLPMKKKKQVVLDAVYEKINERGIWIPYGEFKREANKCIDRQNRKSPLRVPSLKEQYQKKSTVMESERLTLRKMTLQDFEDIKAMLANPDVMYAWEKTFTDEEIRQWIERQKKRYRKERVGYFLAVDKASGTVVGQIGLMYNHIDGRQRLEVGYILKKEFQHMGYAKEGAKCCIEYAFAQMNKGRVYATIRPENTASIAVAKSIGMQWIGEYVKKVDGKEMLHSIYIIDKGEADG